MASTADDKSEVVLSDAFWDDVAAIDRAFSGTPDASTAAAAPAEEPAAFRLLVEDLQAVADTVFFQY